ncbi:mfs allantoate protein [Teratosphaeria destructans]|uniref:Mfs allantoate protein n=1 Tax=Teratosphaeria destructans TaxID=418781 RepID=A0A9W7STR3_9PEZI|nr:mfs allantoate protein [Teratosphaeria destructans]
MSPIPQYQAFMLGVKIGAVNVNCQFCSFCAWQVYAMYRNDNRRKARFEHLALANSSAAHRTNTVEAVDEEQVRHELHDYLLKKAQLLSRSFGARNMHHEPVLFSRNVLWPQAAPRLAD